jgi:tetratricopeptide (TPR) repeat protein
MITAQNALAAAVERHNAGAVDEAAHIYRLIIDADGQNADALHLLGLAERQKGRRDEAVDLMRRALAIRPDMTQARHNLGNALSSAPVRLEEALAEYRRAVALDPGFFESYAALGGAMTRLGGPDHWRRAIWVLERALLLRPRAAEVEADRGLALRQCERLEDAIIAYRRAIELNGALPGPRMSLGNALLEQGELDGARRSLIMATTLLPGAREPYYNLGNTLHAAGRLEEALAAYRRAWRLGLSNGLARAALVLEQLGRREEAIFTADATLAHSGVDVGSCFDLIGRVAGNDAEIPYLRRYFEKWLNQPTPSGENHAGDAMVALAALDLRGGKPHEAARRLENMRGDDCRFFTIRSVARLRATLEDAGLTLIRPEPKPDGRPRISSSTLATHGRFAHNALEYVLLRLYAEKFDLSLETPDWVGGWYFDLQDPRQGPPLSPWFFPRHNLNAYVTGERTAPPRTDCDILSPLFLLEHREIWRERAQEWLKPRTCWLPFVQPAVDALRSRGDTVVAVHIRRGDFVQYKYPITETAWYVEWLNEIWPTLKNPVLYVASDDLDGVRHDFARFAPLTLTDVAAPWQGLEYLQDFHILSQADVVGTSAASGFSLLAARLNTRAQAFFEPDMAARRIRPFSPWT